jgi:putative ABC transport system permease protein
MVSPGEEIMGNVLKIAFRNLRRYQRRTLLTSLLITVGVVSVLVFNSLSGSFKGMMIGQITDSMIGHVQIHRKGFVSSIDNLPLNMTMPPKDTELVANLLEESPLVEAYSQRIKFGAMLSNFEETTNVRLNAVDPAKEIATVPLLEQRLVKGEGIAAALQPGSIIIPELLARGLKINPGDQVVIVATNRDGSVNGIPLLVGGILESATGPGGRDGYLNIDDAKNLLRMKADETSEFAVRLVDFENLQLAKSDLEGSLAGELNQKGMPRFEVHTWEKLSPFVNIAKMIDMMTLSVRVLLVFIALISVMNVMIMAVYERIREIGAVSAMGTTPGKIRALYVTEGFLLGVIGSVVGTVVSVLAVITLNLWPITFNFGRSTGLILKPSMAVGDIVTTVIVVLVVAVAASLQPAVKASRMEPIKALRHV